MKRNILDSEDIFTRHFSYRIMKEGNNFIAAAAAAAVVLIIFLLSSTREFIYKFPS